jgi:hypothetical protein
VKLSAERVARNDAAFRSANEHVEQAAEEAGVELVPFICECADPTCMEIVNLTLAEYELVRSDSRRFLKVPGHEANAGGWARVVDRNDRFVTVEKIGEAAEIAEQLDERGRVT